MSTKIVPSRWGLWLGVLGGVVIHSFVWGQSVPQAQSSHQASEVDVKKRVGTSEDPGLGAMTDEALEALAVQQAQTPETLKKAVAYADFLIAKSELEKILPSLTVEEIDRRFQQLEDRFGDILGRDLELMSVGFTGSSGWAPIAKRDHLPRKEWMQKWRQANLSLRGAYPDSMHDLNIKSYRLWKIIYEEAQAAGMVKAITRQFGETAFTPGQGVTGPRQAPIPTSGRWEASPAYAKAAETWDRLEPAHYAQLRASALWFHTPAGREIIRRELSKRMKQFYAALTQRTRKSLEELRGLVLQYKAQRGRWPATLETLVQEGFCRGQIPADYLGDTARSSTLQPGATYLDGSGSGGGWLYQPATGEVWLNHRGADIHGVPFSAY